MQLSARELRALDLGLRLQALYTQLASAPTEEARAAAGAAVGAALYEALATEAHLALHSHLDHSATRP